MKPKSSALLEVENLRMHFPQRGGFFRLKTGVVKSVDGVSFEIPSGRTLGLVGETGCGKSTLGKTLIRLLKPDSGSIKFDGQEISRMGRGQLREIRRDIQMMFQDPRESLDPRLSVGQLIEEPLFINGTGNGTQRRARVTELLKQVRMPRSGAKWFPYQLSSGQLQRVAIARALALDPKLLILDEPVSALDVSIQAKIMNLLLDLQEENDLSYLFISHDVSVVKHMSDMVAVMYLGKIVEMAPAEKIHQNPLHAYTKSLFAAVPNPSPFEQQAPVALQGDVPSAFNPPPGCAFGHRVGHINHEESIGQDLKFEQITLDHWVLRCPCCVRL